MKDNIPSDIGIGYRYADFNVQCVHISLINIYITKKKKKQETWRIIWSNTNNNNY